MIEKGNHMRPKWIMALLAAAALWTIPARAQDAQTDSDVKCLVLGIELSADPDPKMQTPGQLTSLYFMGRLNGRTPAADLQARILAAAKNMTQADIASTAQGCSTTLVGVGKTLADARDALIKIENDKAQKDAAPAKK